MRVWELRCGEAGMWIADQVGARTGARAVANAGVVAEGGAVGNRERRTRLSNDDAGSLPATQQRVAQTAALEKWQGPDIAHREVMALIEVGVATIPSDVVGVDESGVKAVGRIIDGMAVGVSDAQIQVADTPLGGELKRMIDGVC